MKARPIILVVITLIIGFILGMLTSAQIRAHRLRPVRLYFSEERFREGLYRTIEPDEAQKAEIEAIIEKYAKLNSELQGSFRKELDSNMKEFSKEIDSKLTKEQLARLKEMDEKRQEMIKQARRDHENDSTGDRNFRRRSPDEGPGRSFSGRRPGPPPQPGSPPYPGADSARATR